MKKEIAEKWVAALRSGEFEQGNGVLVTIKSGGTKKHCCLGVLCELAVREGIVIPTTFNFPKTAQRFAGEISVLPSQVQNWAGMCEANGAYEFDGPKRYGITKCLTQDNDQGASFVQIAEIIEAQVDVL